MASMSLTESRPEPTAYYPSLHEIDSTYSDSLESDPLPPIMRVLSPHGLHPQLSHSRSLIHDVSDAEHIGNAELNAINDTMLNELQYQIESHRAHSQCPIPNLESVRLESMTSLKLDTNIEPFRHKSNGDYTPNVKHKETQNICDKLDNINVMINKLNQYIMNHKSSKIKNDTFILHQLTQIQDDIEDSQMYIEEHIDRKLIEMDHEHKMMAMNTDRINNEMEELKVEMQKIDREKQEMFIKQQTQSSIISRLSTLSLINESGSDNDNDNNNMIEHDEKEGNLFKETKGEEQKKWDLQQIKNKKKIYNNYYKEMNEFILKITQPQFKLPRRVIDIISQTQSKLIENNKQFGVEIEKMNMEIEEEELGNIYVVKYMEHKEIINKRMNELRSLNMNSLQCKMDIMDVLNDGNNKYCVFLDKFIHSISRIFFDATVILSTVNTETDAEQETNDDSSVYMSQDVMNVLNMIPLTLKIIKLTDILSLNTLLSLDDLRRYTLNIEQFRLLLIENGMNVYEFIELFAVKMIHCGLVKKNKHKNMNDQIKLISNIFLSMIANKFAIKLLSKDAFNNDICLFIHFMAQIVKYPPILNQINISSHYKKKHKKHLKNVLNETNSEIQINIDESIKTYYNLYSNRSLIKSLRKFEKYIRSKHRTTNRYIDSSSSECYTTNSEQESDDEDSYYDEIVRKRNEKQEKEKQENTSSFMNVFNKFFVKCID